MYFNVSMFAAILPNVFGHIKTYGAESIELEFKLGKVSRHRFDTISKRVTNDSRFTQIAITSERNEFNGTDARRVILNGGKSSMTLYKKKLLRVPLDGGTGNMDVSLERPGQPDTTNAYTIFRDKHRVSYVTNDVWRLDMTRIRTNDPKFADSDEELYEVELELLLSSDMMTYYTLDYALTMGHDIFQTITKV